MNRRRSLSTSGLLTETVARKSSMDKTSVDYARRSEAVFLHFAGRQTLAHSPRSVCLLIRQFTVHGSQFAVFPPQLTVSLARGPPFWGLSISP